MRGGQRERRQRFEAEIQPHVDAAYRVALVLTGRRQDAEDLVQETCLRAYQGIDGFRAGTNARAWLLTILRHTLFNERRKAGSRPVMVPFASAADGEGLAEPADAATPGPEEQALGLLERERILSAIAELPEPYRAAVALVDLAELRYAEAAQVLNVPAGTVMSRLHRGRRQLAEALTRTGEGQRPAELPRDVRSSEGVRPVRPARAGMGG